MSKQLGVRVRDELYEAVESRRRELGQSRVVFVERALEAALGDATSAVPAAPEELPAPPRAPGKPAGSPFSYGERKARPKGIV